MSWKSEDVLFIIEEIKSASFIYDPSHPHHKHSLLRRKFFQGIADKLSARRPGITWDDVKKKWFTIRRTYIGEKNKVEESKRSGAGVDQIYQPSLYYYEMMNFTDNCLPRESRSSMEIETPHNMVLGPEPSTSTAPSPTLGLYTVSADNSLQLEVETESYEPEEVDLRNTEEHSVPSPSALLQKKKSRKRQSSQEIQKQALDVLSSAKSAMLAVSGEEDEWDIYGKHVANRLRKLSRGSQIDVQHQIDCILYNALKNDTNIL